MTRAAPSPPDGMSAGRRADAVEVLAGSAVLALCCLVASESSVSDIEQRVFHTINELTNWAYGPLWLVMQLGSLGAVFVAAAIAGIDAAISARSRVTGCWTRRVLLGCRPQESRRSGSAGRGSGPGCHPRFRCSRFGLPVRTCRGVVRVDSHRVSVPRGSVALGGLDAPGHGRFHPRVHRRPSPVGRGRWLRARSFSGGVGSSDRRVSLVGGPSSRSTLRRHVSATSSTTRTCLHRSLYPALPPLYRPDHGAGWWGPRGQGHVFVTSLLAGEREGRWSWLSAVVCLLRS